MGAVTTVNLPEKLEPEAIVGRTGSGAAISICSSHLVNAVQGANPRSDHEEL